MAHDVKIGLGQMDAQSRRFALDTLAECLSSGRACGTPLYGPVVNALQDLLGRFDWAVDMRSFVGALPHYPEAFTLTDMRATMHRLGFESRSVQARGKDLDAASPTTLVITPAGMLLPNSDGQPGFFNVETRLPQTLEPTVFYECIVFQEHDDAGSAGARESWTKQTLQRFTPEVRNLLALIFLSNTLVILASLFIILIFDKVIPAKAYDTLAALMIGLAGLIAMDLFLRRLRAGLVGRISGRTEYLLGSALFSKLMALRIEMIANASVSEQISRLKQFETVRDIFNGPVVAVLLELPFALMLLATVTVISPMIGLLLIAIIVTFATASAFIFPKLRTASMRYSVARTQHSKLLLETLAQRMQIARSGIGPIWTERLTTSIRRSVERRLKVETQSRNLRTLSTLLTPVCAGAVLVLGAWLVMQGSLQTGVLIATTILLWRLLAPIQQALVAAASLPDIQNLFRQIDGLMALEGTTRTGNVQVWQQISASPGFEGVFFRYPRSAMPTLSNISFSIEEGAFIAVTGPSGSGKTTLLRLMSGLLHPVSGTVSLGGINLDQLPRSVLSQNIGYVSQSPMLFHGTLLQNLTIAAPHASRDEIDGLITSLDLTGDIENLPKGLETRLDHTVQSHLTPGFVSMICLGRALLAKPTVLLLDEPASGLSPEYERAMIGALSARRGRMTCLMVTHRPSHMRQTDLVLSLNSGQMVSFGPPTETRGQQS